MAELTLKTKRGLHWWHCSCGRQSRRGFGFAGHAQMYGRHHVKAKHNG